MAFLVANPVFAESEERDVPSFSKISVKIAANVFVEQGKKQSVKIVAKSSILNDIITEVNDRTLNIRFPVNYIFKKINPGKIDIYITVPEIDGLSLSGSGDISAKEIESRILDLAVSGSGDINVDELTVGRVNIGISGSGNINVNKGTAKEEISVSISGSGNLEAKGFEADNVKVRIAGSGNCRITSNGSINARIVGSGSVYYMGNPSIDSSVAGSGSVKKM